MQLNEIIEENTLTSISNRTRLSVENLEKLFKRDFGGLRKVQALGFISILEREYRTTLEPLRQECLAYFDHEEPVDEEAPVRVSLHPERDTFYGVDLSAIAAYQAYLKPLLASVVGLVLLYAAWQTYSASKGDEGAPPPATTTLSTAGEEPGFFATLVHQVGGWFSDTSDATASAASDGSTPANSTHGGKTFDLTQKSETPTPHTPQPKRRGDQSAAPEKAQHKKAQHKSTPTSTIPVPSTTPSTHEMTQLGDAIASAQDDAKNESAPQATEAPSSANTQDNTEERSIIKEATERALKDAREAQARQEAAARKKAAAEAARKKAAEAARKKAEAERARKEAAARKKAAAEKAAREKAAKIGITLIPRSKVWLGIVDLVTMKRSVKTGKDKVLFKNAEGKGKWIVATGHGRITFKIGKKEMRINDGKKHFILIQNGTVTEISHEEFQKLNGSKVW